jgi:hypothetical protein
VSLDSASGLWRWLALAALVVQLVVSASHVHSDHNSGASVAGLACSLADPNLCPPLDHDDAGDDCELCKALRLTVAFVLPTHIEIPHSIEAGITLNAASVEAVANLGAHSFQARGPPAV